MLRCLLVLFFTWLTVNSLAQKADELPKKLSPSLQKKLQAISDNDQLTVSVSLKDDSRLLSTAFRLNAVYRVAGIYKATLSKKEIISLAAQPEVKFINELIIAKEELNTGAVDYTLNSVRKAQHIFPGIRGDSIFISVKERAFDTTDIDLKGRIFSSGIQAATQTVHASVMATIVAGAGNSSPFALGVAPASLVSSADFTNLFPEPDAFYQQKKISVQNHSYGTLVENFYGNEAIAYDVSVINNPKLVQVFSAGNSGTITPNSGIYNGVIAMANLTGNFKQSKNSISVTALDSSGAPMNGASKGPAYDGRLKPELAAYGEDGSSGAAALVSGTAALIQDAFKKMTGQLPSGDLVKSILINSADDVGAAGVDYLTGYGSLNAYKAVETVLQNRFYQNSLTQNETKTFPINIPAGIAKLKITIVWTDPAALPNAARALVNDIDVAVKELTTNQTWEPWVLNAKPARDSLMQPAKREKDTLNNVEQITIDFPAVGAYQVEVKGTRITTAQQYFSLTYQFDTAARLSWDYPTGSDVLIAGKQQVLRWNSTVSGNGNLQYSLNGVNWLPIITGLNLSSNQYKWTVPDTISTTMLRIVAGPQEYRSDTFVISRQLPLQVGFNCTDSFLLYWSKLPAAQYRLYRLGEKYLEPFSVRADTSVILSKAANPSLYYAIVPVINNREGLKGNTLLYPAAGVDCYLVSFYLQLQTASAALFATELGTLFNVKEVSLQKLLANGYATVNTMTLFPGSLFSFADSTLLNGENIYRLKITLINGTNIYSNHEKLYHFAESPVYVYPNPAAMGEPIKIISNEAGRYTVRILNNAGVELYRRFLTASPISLTSVKLSRGIYFVWVMDNQGKPFSQKLVVY